MTEYKFIETLRGKSFKSPPVWFMRQAGRYLPEYMQLRSKHSMLERIMNPELAAEITLQPFERFDLDAAIIFADILNPLIGMGSDLDFVAGEGPVISNPVRSLEDVDALLIPDTQENTGYTFEAISLVAKKLNPKSIPVIGFCGAPLTLSAYMVEGRGKSKWHELKKFIWQEQEAWHALQQKLVVMLVDYLEGQVKAGASALQIFDSWLSALPSSWAAEFVFPYLKDLFVQLRERVDVPLIYFAPGCDNMLPMILTLEADGLGVGWQSSLVDVRNKVGPNLTLQGNLDPVVMTLDWEQARPEVKRVLNLGRSVGSYVFNVGHGLIPTTNIDTLKRTVELIKA